MCQCITPHFITLGNNVVLDHHVSLFVNPIGNEAQLIIGNGVQLGKYNDFGCSNKIVIEDKVITAPFVHITDRDHSYEDITIPIMDQKPNSKGQVTIKEGCWIGFGVQIMSGVTIGKQSVVAAGSIVTKSSHLCRKLPLHAETQLIIHKENRKEINKRKIVSGLNSRDHLIPHRRKAQIQGQPDQEKCHDQHEGHKNS